MSTVRIEAKLNRLEAPLPPELTAVLARAASREGRSVTDVVATSASAATRRTNRETEVLKLSACDQVAFAESLTIPPPANHALHAAARRYGGQLA